MQSQLTHEYILSNKDFNLEHQSIEMYKLEGEASKSV